MTMTSTRLAWVFAAALAMLMGCASCTPRASLATREKSREAGLSLRKAGTTWEKVRSFTFDDPAELDRFVAVEGSWEIRGGFLRTTGGDRNRAILLLEWGNDPVRIEFDAANTASRGLIGDITVLVGATPDKGFFNAGYAITTGSFWNTCTTVYRKGTALANTSWSPVKSGARNRVAVEYDRGHIRYEMNGSILLETWDTSPLVFGGGRWIGIRTWATLMEIGEVTVFRGKIPAGN